MAAFLNVFCPIDGLLLGSATITNALKNQMGDSTVKEHGSWDLAGTLTCANGHSWMATGRVEVRWDPSG